MKKYNKLIMLLVTTINMVSAHTVILNPQNLKSLFVTNHSAHISPEIINELKDFENLIPTATIDEIIAKHYLIDGNFRTALKYLRSQEFTQLQKQLLEVPEIINVLEFLHLTTANATTKQMGANEIPTTTRVMTSLDVNADDAVTGSYNIINQMTANTDTIDLKRKTMALESAEKTLNLKVPKRPQQFYTKKHNRNVAVSDEEVANTISAASNKREPLVRIVLMEDIVVKPEFFNKAQRKHHHDEYNHHCHNCYHQSSLGTFTTFVEEVLQHLPNAAYQSMINDKCKKNSKFTEFYQALRSSELKSLIDQVMSTDNIKKIVQNLNSHNVDVHSLVPIAFKVISWGPNI